MLLFTAKLLLFALALGGLLLDDNMLPFVTSRPALAPHLDLASSFASLPPTTPLEIPFCGSPAFDSTPQQLCDKFGEVTVSFPPWARQGPLTRGLGGAHLREMDVLPDPKRWECKAQYGEDGFVYREFFYGFEGGIVVESGALDGLEFSTSWGFEKSAHWRSVHVEANPQNYAELVMNRPDAININAGLCSAEQTLHFVSDKVVQDAGLTRTFQTNPQGITPVSGFWEFMSPTLKEQWWSGVRDKDLEAFPTTPCRSLSHLLPLMGITHVDLWILDVEGAEASVLAGFDFNAVAVDVVGVELDGSNSAKDEVVRGYLRDAGYQLHRRGHPHPYRFPSEEAQTENMGPSMIGLDNEWWISANFSPQYEAMVRYARGDRVWQPWSLQFADFYNDSSKCCFSRPVER